MPRPDPHGFLSRRVGAALGAADRPDPLQPAQVEVASGAVWVVTEDSPAQAYKEKRAADEEYGPHDVEHERRIA